MLFKLLLPLCNLLPEKVKKWLLPLLQTLLTLESASPKGKRGHKGEGKKSEDKREDEAEKSEDEAERSEGDAERPEDTSMGEDEKSEGEAEKSESASTASGISPSCTSCKAERDC